MAKGIWRQASKDDPIFDGKFVISPRNISQELKNSTKPERDVPDDDDSHQCHYGEDE